MKKKFIYFATFILISVILIRIFGTPISDEDDVGAYNELLYRAMSGDRASIRQLYEDYKKVNGVGEALMWARAGALAGDPYLHSVYCRDYLSIDNEIWPKVKKPSCPEGIIDSGVD